MKVSLVSVTAPRVEGIKTAEEIAVYCARVSNPSNQRNTETAPKLLKYCVDHGHWSVFETIHATLEIETSRAIAAQILRHRSFSFQEFSQRYSPATGDYEPVEWRRQAKKNRQGSDGLIDPEAAAALTDRLEDLYVQAELLYSDALAAGAAREVARFVLPLSVQTRLYMSGSLRSFIHWLEVRCAPETQKEHREIAEAAKKILQEAFPATAEALGWT